MISIDTIRFEGLSFAHENLEQVFNGVDFSFPMNDVVWIRAASGAGRSSLLQLIARLQDPTQGAYFINDVNVTEMSFEEFLPYRIKIGYSFDYGGLINNRTILENLTLPILYHKILPQEAAEEKVIALLKKIGVAKYKDQRPALVPGGVRKITCMLRSLVLDPQLLLLDDPTVGLNQDQALSFFDILNDMRTAGHLKHIFLSSFDEKFMKLIVPCREIWIDDGKVYGDIMDIAVDESKKVVNL